jgi:hypothetical protein
MANDRSRAEFWKAFIAGRSRYPAPDRLRAQFAEAEFSGFCDCGCNSFAVKVGGNTPPLAVPGGRYGAVYEADFNLSDGRTLEIVLFADGCGNLAFVEVDCCANSYPVPDTVEAEDEPFHTRASDSLLS